jgi:hypothetical protein
MNVADQRSKAEQFRALHIPGKPLLLINVGMWEAPTLLER